jgi:cytochrome P450
VPADQIVLDEAFFTNPYPLLDTLTTAGAVHRVDTPEGSAWLVTRHAEVLSCLDDTRLSVNKQHANGSDYRGFTLPPALGAHLLNTDPPDHTRLRRLVAPSLAVNAISSLRPAVEHATDQLLDAIATRGHADLVTDLAVPLPLAVLGELFALPADARDQLTTWARAILTPADGSPPRARDTLDRMIALIDALLDDKRRYSGADLLSTLVRARDTEQRLTSEELTSMVFYLLFVWYEISVDLIANAALLLLTHPDQQDLLQARPDLLPNAIEELLRHQTPQLFASPRYATTDLTIADTLVPAGDTVLLCLASANRDPNLTATPDQLDLERTPPGHLSFGHGPHRCLGAPLARLQTQTAIAGLVARFPNLSLAVPADQLTWRTSIRHRGVRELPVSL